MSNLTKNARWVFALVEISGQVFPEQKRHIIAGLGRWPWKTFNDQAAMQVLDLRKGDKVIGYFELDVAVCPYARQWLTAMHWAERFFKNHGYKIDPVPAPPQLDKGEAV